MPIHDWQFWVVTAVCMWRVVVLVRHFRPKPGNDACAGCATGTAACSRKPLATSRSGLVVIRD